MVTYKEGDKTIFAIECEVGVGDEIQISHCVEGDKMLVGESVLAFMNNDEEMAKIILAAAELYLKLHHKKSLFKSVTNTN